MSLIRSRFWSVGWQRVSEFIKQVSESLLVTWCLCGHEEMRQEEGLSVFILELRSHCKLSFGILREIKQV